jgi:hypothetical protein
VASLDSIVHILRDLGMRVAMTASDGDSTLLMKVEPAMRVPTAVSGDSQLDPRRPLEHQPSAVAAIGELHVIDADHTGKNARSSQVGPGGSRRFPQRRRRRAAWVTCCRTARSRETICPMSAGTSRV